MIAWLHQMPVELWSSLWLTLQLAAATAIVLLTIAVPLAHWLNNSTNWLRPLIELAVTLPIVLPPTVIGFYLLILLSPAHWIGATWQVLFDSTLTFSFAGLVVGSVVYSLPFAVQPIQSAFRSVESSIIESAVSLGASGWQVFWRIIVPVSRRGILVGASLSFAHTVGEFGVVLMLGGNIPGRTRVASIALYDQVQQLNYASAQGFALVLLLISAALLGAIALLQKKNQALQPRLPL